MTLPSHMKAMVIHKFGEADEFVLAELPISLPGEGQVLIKSAVASVNPADWKTRRGWKAAWFDYKFPFIIGYDAAGVVAAVGRGVTEFAVGDRVVTASDQGQGKNGTYAQYVLCDAARVTPLPPGLSFVDAVTVPIAGGTAWIAVHDVGKVARGQHVFVNGGAGGTGSFAIQFAAAAGARVAATSSAANLDYLRSLGVERPIDYRTEDVGSAIRGWAPEGVDLLVDTVGQGTLPEAVELVRPGGILTPIATLITDEALPDPDRAAARGITLATTLATFDMQGNAIRQIIAAMERGDVHAPHVELLDLTEVAEAHRRLEDGHVRGKIVLRIGEVE